MNSRDCNLSRILGTLDSTSNKLPSTAAHGKTRAESVVFFICTDLWPYSVVENKWRPVAPDYAIPTSRHMMDVAVPRISKEVEKSVKTSLNSAGRVELMCDGWTSRVTVNDLKPMKVAAVLDNFCVGPQYIIVHSLFRTYTDYFSFMNFAYAYGKCISVQCINWTVNTLNITK